MNNFYALTSLLLAGMADRINHAIIAYLMTELSIQNEKLGKQAKVFTHAQRKRLAEKAKAVGRKELKELNPVVTADTLMKWYRKLIAQKYDGSKNREYPGRPKIDPEIENYIIQFAKENPSWGYDRIVGALKNIGHEVSDQTVGNVLKRNGIQPAPERSKDTKWKDFIEQHTNIWCVDFFSVDLLNIFGIQTFYVMIFLHIKTRKIVIGGITEHPSGEFVENVARELTGFDGALKDAGYLIHDRDTKFTKKFDKLFDSADIEILKLPPRSPNLNAHCERVIRSIKEECLNKLILIGEKSLRRALENYVEHYHEERNHQGLNNKIPFPADERSVDTTLPVRTQKRLGGLLKYDHRAA